MGVIKKSRKWARFDTLDINFDLSSFRLLRFFVRLFSRYLFYDELLESTKRTIKITKIWIEMQVEKYECDDYEYRINRVLMFQ